MKCYFFGTFNPVHLGHIEIAKKILKTTEFNQVLFVPSFVPPHKIDDLVPYQHRLAMLKIAVGAENVLDIESKLPVPSYTYRTIEKLFMENKGQKINFIVGYDQFNKLESWKNPEILRDKVNFLVIPRHLPNNQLIGKSRFEYYLNKGYTYKILNFDFIDISSSSIRRFLANKREVKNVVSTEVLEYIERHKLY